MNIGTFLKSIETNWVYIKNNPLSFVSLLFASLAISFIISRWYHNKKLSDKDSVIELKEAEIKSLKERVLNRTEQIETLKIDIENNFKKATEISSKSEKGLKTKTLDYVKELRKLIRKHREKDDEIRNRYWKLITKTDDKIISKELWDNEESESRVNSTELMNVYNENFKIEGILLRDELRSRLNSPIINKRNLHYEHPTNYFGYTEVADDLEKMAKSL